jgi:hypothetical protein
MKKIVMLCAALSVMSAAVALASPQTTTGKKGVKKVTTKVTDVWTCPMTGEKTTASTQAGTPVLVGGKYRVHFCCGGCPESFNKLTDAQKLQKAQIAAKKDSAKTSKG